jgi:PAS domain S-box-containing protein
MNADLPFDAKVLDQIFTMRRAPFLVCDQVGTMLYIDPTARDALKFDALSDRSHTLHDLRCDAQTLDGLEAAIAGIFERAAIESPIDEIRIGSQYALRPLRNFAGSVIGVIVELIDDKITAANDPASPENVDRYRNLVEASSQGIIVHRNNRVLFANQAAATVLGYETPEEVRRLKSIDDYVHPDDRASTQAYRASRGDGEWAPDDYEFRAIRKDGATIWINCRPTILDWDGKPAFQVTFFDVTERKRALEAMARADARFRQLLEQAAVGILVRRSDKIVFANRAIAGMFGRDHPQDILDVGIYELVEAERERANRYRPASDNAAATSTYFEFEGRRQDGDAVWLGCWGQPVTWDEETALLSILVDISERKRLEEELRQSQRIRGGLSEPDSQPGSGTGVSSNLPRSED